MDKKSINIEYFWKIVSAHTIAIFIVGIIVSLEIPHIHIFHSGSWWSSFRPIVAFGFFMQVLRGIILAVIFLPLRKTLFEEKYGMIKLSILIIGLSLLGNISPTIGSFAGFIYRSYNFYFLNSISVILYAIFFIGILYLHFNYSRKKLVNILSIIIMASIGSIGRMFFLVA